MPNLHIQITLLM